MKETVIQIVIGALGTIPKGLVKWLGELKIGGRVETIQDTAEKIPGDLKMVGWFIGFYGIQPL